MSEKSLTRVRIGIVIGALSISGIILLLLPFIAVQFASNPFAGFFLDPNLVVSGTGEPNFIGKQLLPPITYPQRLLTLDGEPVESNQAFYDALAQRERNEVITLTFEWGPTAVLEDAVVEEAFTAERELILPLTQLEPGDLWNQFWLLYFIGLIFWGVGVWAFWVRPSTEAVQIFAMFTAVGSITIAAVFDQVTSQQFLRLWVFYLPLSGGFLLWLSVIYPHETRWLKKSPWMRWLLLSVGIMIGVWGVLWLNHDDPRAYVLPWRFAYLLNAIAIFVTLISMAYRGFTSPSPVIRQQGKIILVCGLIAFLPVVLFFLLGVFSVNVSWLSVTLYIPPVIIFPFAIAYTIMKYGIIDMKMVRRGASYTLLTAILILIFALIATGITAAFGSLAESPWMIAGAVVVVALLFEPLRNWLQSGLDHLFFQRAVTLDDLLRAYNRELTSAVDIDQVSELMLRYIQLGTPEAEAYLYLPNIQAGVFSSYGHSPIFAVNMNAPFVNFMQTQSGLLDLSEERAWPKQLLENRAPIEAIGATMVVPMNGQRSLLGWLALSPKNGRTGFSPSEMSFVATLANQSLIGLERATLMRQLQDRVKELDQLSTFSQFLAFTIEPDDLFELVYTNNQRLLDIDDFFIALRNMQNDQLYVAFHVENDERFKEKEGKSQRLQEPHVKQAIETGQVAKWQDENECEWIAAPLNVAADTLGAVYTVIKSPQKSFSHQKERLFITYAQRTAVALERLQTNQQISQQAQRLQIINQVTLSLASTLELEPLLKLIMNKAIELFDAQAGSLLLTVQDTGELEFHVVRGPAEPELLGTRLAIGTGIAGTAAQTAQSIITNDVASDKRWYSEVDEDTHFETRSILTVPLLRHNRVLGVVQVINKGSGAAFDENDERLLESFASQAVVALENARLVEQTDQKLQSSVEELSMLQQLDRDLNTSLDLANVLNITLERLLQMADGDAGAIVLIDIEEKPQLKAWRGYDQGFDPQKISSTQLAHGLTGAVIVSKRPLIVNNVHEEDRYIRTNFDTKSQLTIPFIHQQKAIGAIVVESDTLDKFSPQDADLALRIANHAAIAIANALLYEQIKAANQAKSEFVSMVSHELKTPMTAIGGYVDLMHSGMTGKLTDQQHEFLETISANIRRMGQQIQDLTDISRIEMNRLYIELAPTSLTAVMDDTLKTVRSLCDEKSIDLNIELPESLPSVEADKGRLVQVMTNLISNACKYSPPETAVWVRFKKEAWQGSPVICVAVQDQGYGISPADQEKLFTKFFRSDDPNIRQSTGTGLGLSITKGIIELHGGEMWLESAVGKGTTFFFTLPISQK